MDGMDQSLSPLAIVDCLRLDVAKQQDVQEYVCPCWPRLNIRFRQLFVSYIQEESKKLQRPELAAVLGDEFAGMMVLSRPMNVLH